MTDATNTPAPTAEEIAALKTKKITDTFSNEGVVLADVVKLANEGLLDESFVKSLEDIKHKFSDVLSPVDSLGNIESLQAQVNQAIANRDLAGALSLNEEVNKLISAQNNTGSDVKAKLEGVSEQEILVAFAPLFEKVLDKVLVNFIQSHQNASLKSKRAANGSKPAPAASTAEQVQFTYDKKEYTVSVGKGAMKSDIKPIAEAHAKATNNPESGKKANFIADLKAGKVKGAKVKEAPAA